MGTLVAWQIDDCGYDGASHVVFAENEAEIENNIENDCYETDGDGDWKITRTPQYDQYANAGKVPNSVLHGDGWYFYCDQCERRTDEEKDDDDYEEWETIPPPIDVQFLGDLVFCCPHCQQVWQHQRQADEERKAHCLELFCETFPGAEIKRSQLYDSGLRIDFRFPGGTQIVEWKSSDPDVAYVLPVDVEAWKLWRSTAKEQSNAKN